MKPKVFITRKIPAEALEKIKEVCEVSIWNNEDVPVPRDVLEKEVVEVDALYSMLTDAVDEQLMEKAKNLKVVSNMAVGFNNIDLKVATKRGIKVTNTPGVLSETTADLTFTLMLATSRRLLEASDFLRQGEWKTWSPMLLTGQDVYGATLGIIGMGRIGEAVARRAKGFDMNILYHNRSRKPGTEEELGAQYTDMETLLKESDFICIMTPYTPETHGLIGEKELQLMKKTAILINTARGGIVNEDALYKALKNEDIYAAGLDVFENEPIPTDHQLLKLPNLVALPHIGSASIKTRTTMANLAVENMLQALNGKVPPNLVNTDVM
ncbi:MAG: D-glycerate dehydrogenase [Firmicutes bacterium]|nr:D-glycerate dehydrogenase [Bacillota bacterium]